MKEKIENRAGPALPETSQSERSRRGVKMCFRLEAEPAALGSDPLVCWSGLGPSCPRLSMSPPVVSGTATVPETTWLLCSATPQGSHSSSFVAAARVPLNRLDATNFGLGLQSTAIVRPHCRRPSGEMLCGEFVCKGTTVGRTSQQRLLRSR